MNTKRVIEIANLPTDRLIEKLVKGELSLEDKEVVLALWIKLLSELDELKLHVMYMVSMS